MDPPSLRVYALVYCEGRVIQKPGPRESEDKDVQDTVKWNSGGRSSLKFRGMFLLVVLEELVIPAMTAVSRSRDRWTGIHYANIPGGCPNEDCRHAPGFNTQHTFTPNDDPILPSNHDAIFVNPFAFGGRNYPC